MIKYLLDTNIVSNYQRNYAEIVQRVQSMAPEQYAISIITVEELLRGRFSQVSSATKETSRIPALLYLHEQINHLSDYIILDYTDQAAALFAALRPHHRRMSSQDLRIATIALHLNLTLVTRNVRDFAAIAGLAIADWTQPSA